MLTYKGYGIPENEDDLNDLVERTKQLIPEGDSPPCFSPALCVFRGNNDDFLNTKIGLDDIAGEMMTVDDIVDKIKLRIDSAPTDGQG